MDYCSTFSPKMVKLEGSWHHHEPPLLPGLARQRGGFGQHQGSSLNRDLQMLEGCPVAKPPRGGGDPSARGLAALLRTLLLASPACLAPQQLLPDHLHKQSKNNLKFRLDTVKPPIKHWMCGKWGQGSLLKGVWAGCATSW